MFGILLIVVYRCIEMIFPLEKETLLEKLEFRSSWWQFPIKEVLKSKETHVANIQKPFFTISSKIRLNNFGTRSWSNIDPNFGA